MYGFDFLVRSVLSQFCFAALQGSVLAHVRRRG